MNQRYATQTSGTATNQAHAASPRAFIPDPGSTSRSVLPRRLSEPSSLHLIGRQHRSKFQPSKAVDMRGVAG